MSKQRQLATFSSGDDLLCAVAALKRRGVAVWDAYSPYPVPGLSKALGLRHSRLGWVTAFFGLSGAYGMFSFQVYMYSHDWPPIIGGKPYASLPAYIPITFEIGVLSASIFTLLALCFRCRLYPGKKARIPAPRLTNDAFGLLLDGPGDGETAGLLRSLGAFDVRLWDPEARS